MELQRRYEDIVQALVRELRTVYGARLLACAVFGSVGRGTPREDSDLDVLIVAEALPAGRTARVEQFEAVESRLAPMLESKAPGLAPIAISPVFKSPAELEAGTPLLLDMVEDARLVYDPDGLLARRLDRVFAL